MLLTRNEWLSEYRAWLEDGFQLKQIRPQDLSDYQHLVSKNRVWTAMTWTRGVIIHPQVLEGEGVLFYAITNKPWDSLSAMCMWEPANE